MHLQKVSTHVSLKSLHRLAWAETFHNNTFFCMLTLSQTSPAFHMSFENSVGKGEIACNEHFLLLPQCFLLFWKTFCHFHQI